MTFYVENETNHPLPFDEKEVFQKLAIKILENEKFAANAQINMLIVSLEEIHNMNKEYRNVDRPTDVLSFPNLSFEKPGIFDLTNVSDIMDPETGEIILGDIVICYEKLKEQAEEYGHSLLREFAFLTAHSLFHLCGYDHMTDEEAEQMEKKQTFVLDELGYTRDCV